jgi:hypothetical protein
MAEGQPSSPGVIALRQGGGGGGWSEKAREKKGWGFLDRISLIEQKGKKENIMCTCNIRNMKKRWISK